MPRKAAASFGPPILALSHNRRFECVTGVDSGRRPITLTETGAYSLLGKLHVHFSGNYMGRVTRSRPARHARPCSVPSGCLAATMNTLAPTLRSLVPPAI